MKRKWIIISIAVVVAGAAIFFLLGSSGSKKQQYQTAQVTHGDIQATVTSTGTIAAIGTVNVGTQVSGTVEDVYVDYNDRVKRGQLLARLDTRVLEAAVEDAKANLDKAQSQYTAALDQYNRNKPLFDKKYISATEFTQYRSALDAAKAGVTSAQVALGRARTNYGYAEIRSPSDGTVIQRTVEPGQTVAASLQTPTLFTIANDLSHMMNILGCLDLPTSGDYLLDGVHVNELSKNQLADIRNAKIGFVFQGFNLLARTSALENVELPLLYNRSMHVADAAKLAREALTRVGLGERADHQPSQLSGGQQQRVAIARALVNKPSLILADEPTGNLDSRTSIEVMALFRELNDQGITVVLITHEPDIASFTKRIIEVRDGLIRRDGPVTARRDPATALHELEEEIKEV
jgi:putative ABC transport system ATP-binding protein